MNKVSKLSEVNIFEKKIEGNWAFNRFFFDTYRKKSLFERNQWPQIALH